MHEYRDYLGMGKWEAWTPIAVIEGGVWEAWTPEGGVWAAFLDTPDITKITIHYNGVAKRQYRKIPTRVK